MKKKIISLVLTVIMCMLPLTNVLGISVSDVDIPDGPKEAIENVLGVLQNAGLILGTFILVFFGFKYLTSGAGEKAKTKDMMIPFLVGAGIVMLAPSLAKWFWDLKN